MAERPARRGTRTDRPRQAALDVLTAVRVDDAYANLVLPQVVRRHGLDARDAAFATELASGTIRLQGLYDAVIEACLTRPRLQPEVRDVLRIGCHQLLSLRVPDHAAISSSVDLARANVGTGPTGLVNAVLRKVASRTVEEWARRVAPDRGEDEVGHLAVARSHPRWMVELLAEALPDPSGLDDLLTANNTPPRVMLVARPGLATVEELAAAGAEPTGRSPYAAELAGGDPGALRAVAEGRAGVQDEGSQLVALALADAEVAGRDERWLDLCAGPGGKAALLAALAARRGAHVTAHERLPHRAALVARAVAAVPPGAVSVLAGDGARPAWLPETFDRALVDAPCTGLGALRRRPEARWRRTRDDLAVLVPLQEVLLDVALDSVRPGGVVVYATCSPVVAETSGVVQGVVSRREDTRVEESFQLWPHVDGTDAMYAATLRRL